MAIDSVLFSNSANATNNTKNTTNNDLGKDAFLKLLVAQLSNQDPLNPMSDTEFVSQMAQFSALEQMTNLNSSMDASRAASMIGKFVTWADGTSEVGGTVTATRKVDGETYLVVSDYLIKLSDLIGVYDEQPE